MSRRHRLDLGYAIHTNRELGLMLRRLKPLASFVMEVGDEPEALVRYLRLFDRQVTLGRFVRNERASVTAQCSLRRVLYAQPDEAWRIEAMIELQDTTRGWSIDGERREGLLLGYTEWEIDQWLAHLQRQGLI